MPSKAKELAGKLGISPKSLRAYLRNEYKRPAKLKGTSWNEALSNNQVVAEVTEHFSKEEK